MKKKLVIVVSLLVLVLIIGIGVSYSFSDSKKDVEEKIDSSKIIDIDKDKLDNVYSIGKDKIIKVIDNSKNNKFYNDFKEYIEEKQKEEEAKEQVESKKTTTNNTSNNNKKENVDNTKKKDCKVSETNKKEEVTSTKYGLKVIITNYYTISICSDGTTEKKLTKKEEKIEKGTFSATTKEMLPEGKEVANKNKSVYNEVLKYVNGYRSEVNTHALTLDNNLSIAATIRAMEIAYSDTFSHTRPNGAAWNTVMSELSIGYGYAGENIAYNSSTSGAYVANQWKNSEGHYKNMINSNYKKIGIGMFKSPFNNRYYWVQLFTS